MRTSDPSALFLPPSSASADASLVVMFFVSLSILFHLNTLRDKFCQRDLIEPTFVKNIELKLGRK